MQNNNSLLRSITSGGIFATLLTPLIIISSFFFPFITGKNYFFRIAVIITSTAWALLALKNPAYRPKFNFVTIAFLAFLIIVGVADVLGINPEKSIWSNYERMEGWVTIFHLFLFTIVTSSFLTVEKKWHSFFTFSTGVSIFVVLYGLFQLSGAIEIRQGGVRLDSTFGNAAYLAAYMLFHLFITAWLFVQEKFEKNWKTFAYIAVFIIQLLTLYFTATRGSILGVLGGIVVAGLGIALFEKERKSLRKFAIGSIVLVVLLVIGFAFVKDSALVKKSVTLSRFADISIDTIKDQPRFIIWGLALKGIAERPLLGWGQEGFNVVFNKYYDPRLYGQEQWFDRVHNTPLDWTIASGILGLIAYLSFFIGSVWFVIRSRNLNVIEKSIFTGVFAAYFFHSLFVFDNIGSYLMFSVLIAFAIGQRNMDSETSEKKGSQKNSEDVFYLQVIVGIVGLLLLYFVSSRGLWTNQMLIQAMSFRSADISTNLEYFKTIFAKNDFGRVEAREQLSSVAIRIATTEGIDSSISSQFLQLADTELKKQVEEFPHDAREHTLRAIFLLRLGREDEALAALNRALELSPRKQTLLMEVANIYQNTQREEEAFKIYKDVYLSETSYRNAEVNYIASAIRNNKTTDVADIVNAKGEDVLLDRIIAQTYFVKGERNKAQEIIQKLVAMEPGNVDYSQLLSAFYSELGQFKEAKDVLVKLVENNPDAKAAIDPLIAELDKKIK